MINPIKTSIITYDEKYRDNSKETILMCKFDGFKNPKTCYLSNNSFETVTALIQKLFTEDTSNKSTVKLHNYWIYLEYYGQITNNKNNVHVYTVYGTKFAMERLQGLNEYYKQEILMP